jgi:hypothetical protein
LAGFQYRCDPMGALPDLFDRQTNAVMAKALIHN